MMINFGYCFICILLYYILQTCEYILLILLNQNTHSCEYSIINSLIKAKIIQSNNKAKIVIIGKKNQMGNKCCSPDFDHYEIQLEKVETVLMETRKGDPSERIAIKIEDIDTAIQSASKIDEIKLLNFKMADLNRKFKTSMKIHKQPTLQNSLPSTYFLPSLDMFYIGEWVYNKALKDNVPGGIGRLYEQSAVSEGIFKTIVLDSEKADKVREKEKQQQMESCSKLSNNFPSNSNQFDPTVSNLLGAKSSAKKLDRLLFSNRSQITEENLSFVVKLHGPGRIYSKQQMGEQQIEMEGQFDQGILHGKGTLKIMWDGEEKYSYNGLWKKGDKHGKGVEKTHNYKYEGTFYENSKHGKGIQTFSGSMKEEHEVENDVEKMKQKMVAEGDNMKIEALKKVAIREYQQKIIESELDKKQYPASHIRLPNQKRFTTDMNFILERTYRTVFTECYSGDFQYDKMDGYGTYIWSNGKTYKGKWVKNKLHGNGQFYWPDGSYFHGIYENDERNGEGTMVWNSLKRYRGNWTFGLRHGYGESIQMDEEGKTMTVKGSIWDRDKVKTKRFQETLPITGWNDVEQIERYIEDQFSEGNEGGTEKDKEGKNGEILFGLLSLKAIKDNWLVNEVENQLNKIM